MKKLLTAVMALTTFTACPWCSCPTTKKVTILFEGLMAYVDTADHSVWVILPDARDPGADMGVGGTPAAGEGTAEAAGGGAAVAGADVPAHLPMVFFSGPAEQLANEVPWILDNEEIHFDSDQLSGAVDVDSDVWDGLASLSSLAPGNSIDSSLTADDPAGIPDGKAVARLHLKGGKLTVDSRDEAVYDDQVEFKTLAGTASPYTTPSAALLLRWEAEVQDITFRATRFLNGDETHSFVPTAEEVRGFIGNLPVIAGHGLLGKDEHFADLYSLMTGAVAQEYVPHYDTGGIAGSRVCMGGKQ
jgi:hypothetical protein